MSLLNSKKKKKKPQKGWMKHHQLVSTSSNYAQTVAGIELPTF
jgi:hypothetical protein